MIHKHPITTTTLLKGGNPLRDAKLQRIDYEYLGYLSRVSRPRNARRQNFGEGSETNRFPARDVICALSRLFVDSRVGETHGRARDNPASRDEQHRLSALQVTHCNRTP